MVKPLLVFSKYFLDWVVDVAILGGAAWLLGGVATLCGRDFAALAVGQSALVCGVAGGWRRGAAAVCRDSLDSGAGQSIGNSSRRGGALENERINKSILTLILLVPLAGAVLVALVPDRGKLPNWIALLTSLVTFGLTLHLPAHFDLGQGGFQFEINRPWIEKPAIFYHVGVDGLSLWLVVLAGLLAPVGVLASWNAITERRKVFYSLFLVQQTAMFGVFISLDLMLYYGFWELSLVPMAILIAMYGRKDGPKAALKFFLFTFIPSAPLLVAILWLYAKTGSFDFATLQILHRSRIVPRRAALLGRVGVSASPLPSRCRSFRCTAGWPTPTAKRLWPWRWSWPASWACTQCCASTSVSSLCRRRQRLPG